MLTGHRGACRILLVDDDDLVRRALARLVLRAGYEVVPCADVERALVEFVIGRIDVVVSDWSMPGRDGVAFLRVLRRQGDGVPFILMTGTPSVETASEARELGVFEYLVKPVDELLLLRTVWIAVGGRCDRGDLARGSASQRTATGHTGPTSGEFAL
jgi:DNA-binding NtrC family response regulator